MSEKHRVNIPCSIERIDTTPIVIELDGRYVPRDRHTVKVKIPTGHTVEMVISGIELQKLKEILPDYTVDEET